MVGDDKKVASGRISVSSLTLDGGEWTLAEQNPLENVYVNKAGDVVGVELRTEATAFQVDFNDLAKLRANIREGFGGAGLISADVEQFGSAQATIKGMAIITKLPQIPSGMSYNGLIFLPFKEFSYSLYMRYEEGKVTGLRDAVVLDLLMKTGEVTVSTATVPPTLHGLAEDLYEPKLRGLLVRSKAEREEYDKLFPDHPLSKLRSCMVRVKQALLIDPIVLSSDQ